MEIKQRKIKLNSFSAELPGELDRNKRTFVTVEADIWDVSTPDNHDGTFNELYRAKVNGSTIVKQEGMKDSYVCKSKRSPSERLRAAFWKIESDSDFYEIEMDKIILNLEEVIEFLKNK